MHQEYKYMQIRKTKYEDIEKLLEIFDYARKFMAANNNPKYCGFSAPLSTPNACPRPKKDCLFLEGYASSNSGN